MTAQNLIGMTDKNEHALTNQFSSGKAKTMDLGGELRRRSKKIAFGTYNFTVHGGAVSTIMLVDDAFPANAVITDMFVDVVTAATSGGSATYSVLAGSTAINTAVAFDDATNGINGTTKRKYSALDGSATAIKVAAASDLNIAIAGAALTAGKVHFAVEYYISD